MAHRRPKVRPGRRPPLSNPPRRTFASLRPAGPAEPTPEKESDDKCLRRVFQSTDGLRALQIMADQVNTPTPLTADLRALQEAEGARRFIHNLKAKVLNVVSDS